MWNIRFETSVSNSVEDGKTHHEELFKLLVNGDQRLLTDVLFSNSIILTLVSSHLGLEI